MRHGRTWWLLGGALLLATGAGCIGSIGGEGDRDATGEDGAAIDCALLTPRDTLAAAGMQRLTRDELNNSLRDLFGDERDLADMLPEDDRVGSFRSNSLTSASPHAVGLYATIADAVADRVAQNLDALLPCSSGGLECAEQLVMDLGRRLYRRPLADEERERLLEAFEVGAETDFETGARLVIAAMLQSPHFLYRVELGEGGGEDEEVVLLTGYELASRLSFFLWRSTPDDALLDAAASGALDTREGLTAQAKRLVEDPRAEASIQSFYAQLLGLDSANGLASLEKDGDLFPAFTESVKRSMDEEMRRFVTWVYRDGDGTLEALLTSPVTFVDAELAPLYDVEAPSEGFAKVTLDATRRAGLVTQLGVMAVQAGYSQTSPTHRGKLIRDAWLCDVTPPPPPSVADDLAAPVEGETKREQLAQHLTDPSCKACHERTDPVGLGFENYDAVGVWRDRDGSATIDPTGEIIDADESLEGSFDGAVDLAAKLATSDQVESCVVRQWTRYALGRKESDDEARCTLEPVRSAFAASGGDLRDLIVQLVALDTFRSRRLPQEN